MFTLLLLACGTAPHLQSISPAELSAGQALSIEGADFGSDAVVWLQAEGQADAVPLNGLSHPEPGRLKGTVPVGLAEGRYTVGVTSNGMAGRAASMLSVVPLPLDVACSGLFSTNTTLSLANKEVRVDRFYLGGERKTVQLSLDAVSGIVLEETLREEARCSAIYLERSEGARVLFTDDSKVSLKEQAERLSESTKKPLRVHTVSASSR